MPGHKGSAMKGEPVPTYVQTNEAGEVVGWKNAFGEFKLTKGLTERVGNGVERSKR